MLADPRVILSEAPDRTAGILETSILQKTRMRPSLSRSGVRSRTHGILGSGAEVFANCPRVNGIDSPKLVVKVTRSDGEEVIEK